MCLKPIQSRQPLQFGNAGLGAGTAPDRLNALSKLAISQRAPGCIERRLDRVELIEYLFARLVRFNHADDGMQMPLS